MKAVDGDIIMVPLPLLYNAVLSFESVNKILNSDNSSLQKYFRFFTTSYQCTMWYKIWSLKMNP